MAGRAHFGGTRRREEPSGRIRRSQVVGTFGPGALIDLVDQAVLVGGLDFWGWDKRGVVLIQEPRLRDALVERFRMVGRPLSVDAPFREPPAGDDRDASRSAGVQVLEFPLWFVCQNPSCRALTRSDALNRKNGRYMHECSRAVTTEMVPIRFVAACRRGHVQDFPWIAFAHNQQKGRCASPQLKFEEGASGDFSQIVVECTTCHASDQLARAYTGVPLTCSGDRPWLGSQGVEICDEKLRIQVRTASNSYFGQIVSALSVPDPGNELASKVSEVWDVLKAATPETLSVFRTIPKVLAAIEGFADADVLAAVETRRLGTTAAREPLRSAEFRQFVSQPDEIPGQGPPANERFFARRAKPTQPLPGQVANLILASRLREVRAQIGFTRLDSVTPNLEGEFDLKVESSLLGLQTDWLPATEILGEGVFIQFDEARISAWENRASVRAREKELLGGYDYWVQYAKGKGAGFPGVRFYLLHSLAHLLISAISLECGYAASAIRERVYCSAPGATERPMAGILLSTGTPGTEGTLGGLVEQGRQLTRHLRLAFDLGVLCSNDPVCASHSPQRDYAERYLEGAACHGCLFIAECSCEWFNRYLDRSLVVPTIGHPADLAFFAERP